MWKSRAKKREYERKYYANNRAELCKRVQKYKTKNRETVNKKRRDRYKRGENLASQEKYQKKKLAMLQDSFDRLKKQKSRSNLENRTNA